MSNNRQLTWRHLKALHELYTQGQTKAKILDNAYVKNCVLNQKKLIKQKASNVNILEIRKGYLSFYENEFKDDFLMFEMFLQKEGLETDAKKRYDREDILTLMFIADHKEDLVANLSTTKTFSSQIFKGKGSKYLENHPGLKKAVCQILGISDFPEKDPKNLQWRLVVDCVEPVAIVLCENISHLKNPRKAIENNLELWYVGGNNIGIIDNIGADKLSKPIFYSCDWDYHGLQIYSAIRRKLAHKSTMIKILVPYTMDLSFAIDSPFHNSEWKHDKPFSGLIEGDFQSIERDLIKELIRKNEWIEEESLDLLELLTFNNVILKHFAPTV